MSDDLVEYYIKNKNVLMSKLNQNATKNGMQSQWINYLLNSSFF